jgi:hypothetical protein
MYRGGLPVPTVAGTPEEIGAQVGALAVQPACALLGRPKDFRRAHGLEWGYPLLLRAGASLVSRLPPDHLTGRSARRSQLPQWVHPGSSPPDVRSSHEMPYRSELAGPAGASPYGSFLRGQATGAR